MPSAAWDYRLETVYILLLDFLAFGLIGLGPALLLWPGRRSAQEALSLCPVFGFSLTLCAAVWFGEGGLPVKTWSLPWLLACAGLSVGVLLWKSRQTATLLSDKRELAWLAGTTATGILVLVLPAVFGGQQFVVLRGNAWDTFNYVDMAYSLDELPLSVGRSAPLDDLVHQAPEYVRAQPLLFERWATAAILAFCADVSFVPIYRCEYAYPALMFLLAVSPAFVLARLAGAGRGVSSLASLTTAAGFHAQVLLDMRAFSQANSVSLFLVLVILLARSVPSPVAGREAVCIGLCLAALFAAYVELFPLIGSMIGIGVTLGLITRRFQFAELRGLCGGMAFSVLFAFPGFGILLPFLRSQTDGVLHKALNFHEHFFPWLLIHPFLGIWGLDYPGHLVSRQPLARVLGPGLGMLALVLGGIVVWSLVREIYRRDSAAREARMAELFLHAGLMAGICQCVILLGLGKSWPACKGMLFLYPLLTLIITLAGTGILKSWSGSRGWVAPLLGKLTLLWLMGQVTWGMIRIGMAATGNEYAGYMQDISNPYTYRRHDLDLRSIQTTLAAETGETVIWAAVPDFLLSRYLGYGLRGYKPIFLEGIADKDCRMVAARQPLDELPTFLLLQRRLLSRSSPLLTGETAGNTELVLVRAPQQPQVLLQILEGLQQRELQLRRSRQLHIPGEIEMPQFLADMAMPTTGLVSP